MHVMVPASRDGKKVSGALSPGFDGHPGGFAASCIDADIRLQELPDDPGIRQEMAGDAAGDEFRSAVSKRQGQQQLIGDPVVESGVCGEKFHERIDRFISDSLSPLSACAKREETGESLLELGQ